jgi:hypothetical protein
LPLKDDLLKQLDGIVEGKVKVDGLLLLRYYHIFFICVPVSFYLQEQMQNLTE